MDPEVESRAAPAAPPVMGALPPVYDEPPPKQKATGPLAGLLAALLAIGKWILPILKFGPLGKLLLTGGTMFLSIWFYALAFGWQFAAGFVICILVHEMGHVAVAAWQGVPVTAPIFIPGMGALILHKRGGQTVWSNALIGIGGPVAGGLAALACWGLFALTGNHLFLALAMAGFMINLFNLLPIMPLDGGWVTAAVSPYLWLLGVVGFGALAITGTIRNPLVWILIITSLPYLWHGIRYGTVTKPGEVLTTNQKLGMGVAYLALAGFLAWANYETHLMLPDLTKPAPPKAVNRGPVA